MKILFMGTPDFALESLKALYEANYDIVAIVTNVDKPKGRGMKLQYSPVKEFAIEKNIRLFQPEKVRGNEEFENEIKQLGVDLACVVAYGKILPQSFLDIPKYGCINVHGSLLPKYRGAAPIQRAVLNGDTTTGITTMFMDAGMDTGDMILSQEVSIFPDETTGELWGEMAKLGGELLVKTIELIESKKDLIDSDISKIKEIVGAQKQGEAFSLAPMLNKEEAIIDWNKDTTNKIHNLVRGLNPLMGAITHNSGKIIKIWKTHKLSYDEINELNININNDYGPGQVIYSNQKKGLIVKTIDGCISIIEIQPENSKRLLYSDFINGNHVAPGYFFE